MTMHLARGLSTLRTAKPKQQKLTQAQQEKLVQEHRAYNKRMRQAHAHDRVMTFEDYVKWTQGTLSRAKPPQYKWSSEVKTFDYKLPDTSRGKQYASLDSGKGVALLPEKKTYTGTLIKGIATMHKSNAVPVINDEEAKSISQMRRN
jgi:hypothetical protein